MGIGLFILQTAFLVLMLDGNKDFKGYLFLLDKIV